MSEDKFDPNMKKNKLNLDVSKDKFGLRFSKDGLDLNNSENTTQKNFEGNKKIDSKIKQAEKLSKKLKDNIKRRKILEISENL